MSDQQEEQNQYDRAVNSIIAMTSLYVIFATIGAIIGSFSISYFIGIGMVVTIGIVF